MLKAMKPAPKKPLQAREVIIDSTVIALHIAFQAETITPEQFAVACGCSTDQWAPLSERVKSKISDLVTQAMRNV